MSGDPPRRDVPSGTGVSAGREHGGESDAEEVGATDAATAAAQTGTGTGAPPHTADTTMVESPDPPTATDATESLKACNLCQLEFPRSQFKLLSGGRTASYCTPCTSLVCRGRSRGLSIEVLRRAMQDGTLEAALQRDTPVPSDRKRCKLCGEIKALENFRELPRGGHESYCRPCNKYVRRGIKRGLHIEAVRQAFMEGTIDTLLSTGPSRKQEPCKPGHKRCNLCSRELQLESFAVTPKGWSSYCGECDKLVRRGRNKGLFIEDMRTAYKEGNIEELLPPVSASSRQDRRTQNVPEGHKVCNLCENVRPQSSFKLKYDGNHCSYCNACDKLVGRGRRRGLSMDVMRASFKDGTLQNLLDTYPIVQVAAGGAEGGGEEGGVAASTSALASGMFGGAAGAGGSSTPRVKNCNLCSKEKPVENFRIVSGGRIGAYCVDCDRLIGRGRRRGLSIDDIRAAQADNTLDSLLGIASGDGGGTLGVASGALPDRSGARRRRAARRQAGSDSGVWGGEEHGPLLHGESGAVPGSSEISASPLGPELCVKCGNTFVPNARGETLCMNCTGFQLHHSTSAAGPSMAAEDQLASARRRKRHLEGTAVQTQAAAGPLAAGVSGSSAVQLDTQRTGDRGEQQSKRHCTAAGVEGQQGLTRASSPTHSSATLSQDDSMDG